MMGVWPQVRFEPTRSQGKLPRRKDIQVCTINLSTPQWKFLGLDGRSLRHRRFFRESRLIISSGWRLGWWWWWWLGGGSLLRPETHEWINCLIWLIATFSWGGGGALQVFSSCTQSVPGIYPYCKTRCSYSYVAVTKQDGSGRSLSARKY